ncbi:hypothetical protein, partial [Brumimicrobium mesophilum]|uniref:hypothetical protein n=1 Tax=Brumimicrobium mesophilum TaxID=392717 RepID=UPI0018FE175E
AGPNGFSSSSQYPAGIVASSLTAGEYTLSVTTNGCGTATNSVIITVNPLPTTPVLSALSNNVCQGDDIVLTTGATATDYYWIASNGDTTITQTPSLTVNSGVNYASGNWTL